MRERVLETIQRKVEGQEITSDVAVGAGGGDKIIDLMAALKGSLAKSEKGEKSEKPAARKQKAS